MKMATTVDFIEYVCSQIEGVGAVRHKKMFGEYMVYVNNKPLLGVCNSTVYVKMLPCVGELLASIERGSPYNGAKEHYIVDADDRELLLAVIKVLEPVVPVPKPRKKKGESK
jgi:hypothetical protein